MHNGKDLYNAPSSQQYSILIIEESKTLSKKLITHLCKNETFRVEKSNSFNEASKKLKKRYDLIILDLDLSDAFGENLLDAVQQHSQAKIIVLSNKSDKRLRKSLLKKGVLDCFKKDKYLNSSIIKIASLIESLENNKNYTVLLIIDSLPLNEALIKILKTRNYQVKIARSTHKALSLLKSYNIHTIVLDLEVSNNHGLDLLQAIGDIEECSHIPTIIISATKNIDEIRSAINLGATDFIKKPDNIEEFFLKIELGIKRFQEYNEVLRSKQNLHEYKEAINVSSLVSKTDTNGIITFANEAFCELSGYTKEELIGHSHNIITHPDMPKAVFKELWQTIKDKKIWKGVIKNLSKSGEAYYVQSTILPILDKHNNIIEYISIRIDISELEAYKKILETKLIDANNNLQYLMQYEYAIAKFIALIKTDAKGKITDANDNFCTISGYRKEELLGRHSSEFRAIKHFKNGDCDAINRRLKNKEHMVMLFENIAKDGSPYYLDTHIFPIFNKKNKIVEYLHLMYNITETITLHHEIEKTQKEIIYKMGEIGETRSNETGNHVKRVAEYSKLLAELCGLDKKQCEILYTASPMHDIGKVGIPDAILHKPGRLTEPEFEIMKTHSQIGFDVLKGSKQPIIKSAAVVALTHHEKFDGSGYPMGTRGKRIHIFGRITALVDVFDALGSDRCYKKAWKLEKILQFLKKEKGKHFDPELIDLFFQNLDKFLKIRNSYKD